MRSAAACALLRGLVAACASVLFAGDLAAAPPPDARLNALADEYLGRWLEGHPQIATRLGDHEHDGELEPVTEAGVSEDLAWLVEFRARLESVPKDQLSFDRALDRDLLMARLLSDSLELAVIRRFRFDPGTSLELVAGSVESALERSCASPCARARAAARRLSRVPEVLRAAKLNLKRPCAPLVVRAIAGFRDVLLFYRERISSLTADCRDPRQQADLAEADSAAVAAVDDFIGYLGDLRGLPADSLAIGNEGLQLLLASEMETTPVETLLVRAEAQLDACRRRLDRAAARLSSAGGLAAALDSLAADGAGPQRMVPRFEAALEHVRPFLTRRRMTSFLLLDGLKVREPSPGRSGLALESLDVPGPWENCSLASFLEVASGDSVASGTGLSDLSPSTSRSTAELTAIREGWPGRCLRLATLRQAPSRIRQVFLSPGNVGGWGGYCEQVAIEDGYGRADPRVEMAHELFSLESLGRLVVGLSFHRGRMTFAQATEMLKARCALTKAAAAREALRAVAEPESWLATLGQWKIAALRDEVRQRLGPRFRAVEFHDAFLKQGGSVLPIVRLALLRGLETPSSRR